MGPSSITIKTKMKSSPYHLFLMFSNVIVVFLISIHNKNNNVFIVAAQAQYRKEPEFLRHNINRHRSLQEEQQQQQQRTCFTECQGMQAEDCISIIEKETGTY